MTRTILAALLLSACTAAPPISAGTSHHERRVSIMRSGAVMSRSIRTSCISDRGSLSPARPR